MSEAQRPPPAEGARGGRGGGGGGNRRKGRGGGRGGRGGNRSKQANDNAGGSTPATAGNKPLENANNAATKKSKRGGGRNKKQDDGAAAVAAAGESSKKGGRNRRRGGGDRGAQPQVSPQDLQKQEEAKRLAAEKAAAEEERKRVEQEKKAMEAAKEKRRQEELDLNKRVQDAVDSLDHMVETTELRKSRRQALAAESLVLRRKEFQANKKTLKSDLKKCSALVRKIKSGGAWSLTPAEIQKEVAALNLSRYVDEVASALLESSKLKVADLPVVVALCVSMHERYPDFLPALLPSLWSTIEKKATEETAKTRRLYVRLVTEFLLNGVLTDAKQLIKIVGEATGGTAGTYAVSDAILVVSFVKAAGFEILGTKPRSIQKDVAFLKQEVEHAQEQHTLQVKEPNESIAPADASPDTAAAEGTSNAAAIAEYTIETATPAAETETEKPIVISQDLADKALQVLGRVDEALEERALAPPISEVFSTHCLGAYQTLSTTLVTTHGKLQKLEKRCEQDRLLSGALSESREKGLTDARKLSESLQKSVEALSDVLDQDMPVLQEEEEDVIEGSGVGVELWTKEGGDESFGPFDDEETRDFYCDIPDLLTTIPPALLGMTLDDVERIKAQNIEKYGTGFDVVEEEVDADVHVTPSSEGDLEAAEALLEGAGDEEQEGKEKEENVGEDASGEENKDTPHYKLMLLLEQELPECSRREQVDEVAEKFCANHGTSKNSRKRLSSTLFLVPRTRLDLLPYYSRMAAILDRVYPEVASSLVTELEQQFHGQAKFKKNQNVESRLKTARYIGELTKFRVAPPIVALRCLRRCLDDFSGFNIDVACCLLESCGRYLYRTKHTEARLTGLLDTMMRISKAKNLDERSVALIKSAFFMVKPPPAAPRKQAKVYPPLEAYLRHLLMNTLSPDDASVAFVTKQLLRFPWSDPSKQCGALICKIMLKTCRRGRYKAIGAVASVVAGMKRSKPEVPSRVVDGVLEELQWAMEHPSFREQQRTISYARLLGELHCSSLVTASVVLNQLYNFINFGHEIPDALKEISEKQIANAENAEGEAKSPDLPVFNSTGGTTQTIHEDEELEDEELVTNEEKTEPSKPPQVVAVSRHSVYDPRVPSVIDPSSSCYRVSLVCTLLEAALPSLVTRSNLTRVEGFLTAFQRYLFTKDTLPTEVEFAVLDIFDNLDSRWKVVLSKEAKGKRGPTNPPPAAQQAGFQRYDTWIEAHNATIAVEETDAVLETRTKARLAALAGLCETTPEGGVSIETDSVEDIESGLAMLDLDEDESVEDVLSTSAKDSHGNFSDSEMESDDEDMSGSETDDDSHSEGTSEDDMSEGSNESDEESEDDDFSDEEELDEEAYAKQLEEELFERELRRITMEALEKGKVAARKQVADTMPTGSQFVRKKPAAANVKIKEEEGPTFALGGQQGISLQLLKRGNKGKVEAKELVVPNDTNLAKVATKQDDEAARERDMLKARVLQYEAESNEQQHAGGNVYIEQQKLTVIRNRPLSMEDIDRNFGSTGGDYVDNKKGQGSSDKPRSHPSQGGRSHSSQGGRGRGGRGHGRGGRGGGRGRSGRGLVH